MDWKHISNGWYAARCAGHRIAVIRHAGVWRLSPPAPYGAAMPVSPDLSGWEAYRTLAAAKARAEDIFDGLAQ